MSEQIENSHRGVTIEWLYDGRIAVFQVESIAPSIVDAWYESSLEVIQNWPATKPYLVLERFLNLGLTPYNRQRAEELAALFPRNLHGRMAVVISRGVLGYGIRMFGANRLKVLVPHLTIEFFFDEDKALAWLEELL